MVITKTLGSLGGVMGEPIYAVRSERHDRDILSWALPFYLGRTPSRIIDLTWGKGNWWWGNPVLGLDISGDASVWADYRHVPLKDDIADVVAFDPPHWVRPGRREAPKKVASGSYPYGEIRDRLLADDFQPVATEAVRLLRRGGIFIGKTVGIAGERDYRARWPHVQLMDALEGVGLTVCDLLIKVRRSPIMPHKQQHHARKNYSMLVVARKGGCYVGHS